MESMRCGHPVEREQWLSTQKIPQKTRRLSSSSAQLRGGRRVGMASPGAQSRRWSPIIWTSLTARAQLIAARVNVKLLASSVAMRHHACYTRN